MINWYAGLSTKQRTIIWVAVLLASAVPIIGWLFVAPWAIPFMLFLEFRHASVNKKNVGQREKHVMNDLELDKHLEYVDGIQKAQMVALRLLLREQPQLRIKLQQYTEQMDLNPPVEGLSAIQLQAMKTHLLGLSQ